MPLELQPGHRSLWRVPEKLDNSKAEKLAKEKTANGRLSRSDANEIRRVNLDSRLTVTVDASKLKVLTNKSDLDKKGYTSGITLTDWSTHGSVGVEGSSSAPSIKTEEYNFESHEDAFFRNLETDLGRWHAGEGMDFNIKYQGSPVLINNPF